jgi:group I intron endonuclease
MGIIYCATNKLNDKKYVGFTSKELSFRMNSHRYDAERGLNSKFHNAIRKYGWNSFIWEILLESEDNNFLLNEMEAYYIKLLDTYKNGYNLTLGGRGHLGGIPWNKGIPRTFEIKQKLREQRLGLK